jgi:hypothetical protein
MFGIVDLTTQETILEDNILKFHILHAMCGLIHEDQVDWNSLECVTQFNYIGMCNSIQLHLDV